MFSNGEKERDRNEPADLTPAQNRVLQLVVALVFLLTGVWLIAAPLVKQNEINGALWGPLVMGSALSVIGLAVLIFLAAESKPFSALRYVTVSSAMSAGSCLLLSGAHFIAAVGAWRAPELYGQSVYVPLFIEMFALVLMGFGQSIFGRVVGTVLILVSCLAAAVHFGTFWPFLGFAAFRLWPMVRNRPKFPVFLAGNFMLACILMPLIGLLIAPAEVVTERPDIPPAAVLGAIAVYFFNFAVYELLGGNKLRQELNETMAD